MAKEVTMRDIAKQFNVSTVTVSKALTDKDGVSSELRQAIKQKAEELGYQYSITKNVSERKSYNIGVLVEAFYVEDTASGFYLKMYQSIVMQLSKKGYFGILELLTDDMLKNGILPKILTENKVDGMIALGKIKNSYLQRMRDTGIPIVYLDYYDRHMEVPSVITDNVYGAYMITNYVASMGHRKIAYVGNLRATPSILDRYLGYARGLIMNDIPYRPEYLICDRDEDGRYIDMELPEDMPTAFVCNCDQVAYMLMERLKKMGYQVPKDISVVGFDNSEFAGYSSPKLTTVEVNVESMTETACEVLIRLLRGGKENGVRKVISGTLIVRDSVADRNENNK